MAYLHSTFEQNLNFSQVCLRNSSLQDYWINKDGTYQKKSFWFDRLVRWIVNFFTDKTIRDIWYVFNRTSEAYFSSRDFPLDGLSEVDKRDSIEFISNRKHQLEFAIDFLLSRKFKFDQWIKKYPQENQKLKKCLDSLTKNGEQALQTKIKRACFPSVNLKMLSMKPPKIKLRVKENTIKYSGIDLSKLPDLYFNYSQETVRVKKEQKKSLERMIDDIKQRNMTLAAVSKGFYATLECYLKNIIDAISDNSIPKEKKVQALTEIAKKATRCPAVKLEIAGQEYRNLFLANPKINIDVVEQKILFYNQKLKDDLLNYIFETKYPDLSERRHMNLLNTFRSVYGNALGLDDSPLVIKGVQTSHIKLDKWIPPYHDPDVRRCVDGCHRHFLREYNNTSWIVESIAASIHNELVEYHHHYYYEYLIKIVTKKGLTVEEEASDYVLENYCSDQNLRINYDGVKLILQEVGILL